MPGFEQDAGSVADDNKSEEPNWECLDGIGTSAPVATSLLEVWQQGDNDAVYRLLAIDVAPRLISHLRTAYSLQDADCEDCLSTAYERFGPAVQSRKALSNPYGYFFKIGINSALELLRERRADLVDPEVDIEAASANDDLDVTNIPQGGLVLPDPPVKIAVELVEDAVSELEVEDFWAVEVVRIAVERLPPSLRRVAQALMYMDLAFHGNGRADFDYSAQAMASDLGMTPGAFRTAKHRAYAAIQASVPALIVELGLAPPERAESAIFPNGRGRFMDDGDSL